MKKNYFVLAGFLALIYIVFSSDIDGAAHHGHGDLTGAPTGTVGHCQTSSCHGSNNPLTVVNLTVSDSTTLLPVSIYNANKTYLITLKGDATAVGSNLPQFGFMVSAVLGTHVLAGSYTIPTASSSNIHTYPCGVTTVVEHTLALPQDTIGINKYTIQFYWTAPATFSDSVTFYSLLNAVNGDGGKTGDYPDVAPHVTIYEDPADAVPVVNAGLMELSIYPNPATNQISINAPTIITTLIITNIAGKVVDYQFPNATQFKTNVTGYTKGVYFVMVNGVYTARFVKE